MKAMKPFLNALLVTAAVITLSGAAMAQSMGTETTPDSSTTGTTTFDNDTTTGSTGGAAGSATAPSGTGEEAQLDTEQVEQLEQTLSSRGYSIGMTDGIMDSQTEAALREFQEDNNLAVTGTVTTETLAELGMESGAGTGTEGMQAPDTTDSTETDTSGSMD